ncbi:MAG: MipA/OmpV family protein [Defluviimonas sp.]|nr:MipA/OmpV family protein [Defluviimonas sp.]
MRSVPIIAAFAASCCVAPAALAQQTAAPAAAPNAPQAANVLEGDFLTIGAGAAVTPSYEGSDDYEVNPLPFVTGSLGGVGISPRGAGLALDFINDRNNAKVTFAFGPTVRLRTNRDGNVEDEVMDLLPDLDTAVEVGPTAGIAVSGLLNPYDRLSFSGDVKWDVADAHGGMTIAPNLTYTTPLSRGILAAFNVGAEYADDDYMDYYFSVTPADAALTGLPVFEADGGFKSAGANLLLGIDFNGDLTDGGLAMFLVGGYSRLLGDAKDTPFTAIRGSADQWIGGAGLAYTF